MENIVPIRIQIISILASLLFLITVSRLIIKGRLREEYAFFWVGGTLVLLIFSFWRNGLDVLSKLFGVYQPPNLVFLGSIFAILVYLLHLSTVVSKLQEQNKRLAQDLALMKAEKAEKEKTPSEDAK
jgi:hypothetical protein